MHLCVNSSAALCMVLHFKQKNVTYGPVSLLECYVISGLEFVLQLCLVLNKQRMLHG